MRNRKLLIILGFTLVVCAFADDYIDDVYYWAESEHAPSTSISNAPDLNSSTVKYDEKIKEIIFIEDSASTQSPDTVKAIIREKR